MLPRAIVRRVAAFNESPGPDQEGCISILKRATTSLRAAAVVGLASTIGISSVASTGCTQMRVVSQASPPTQPPTWVLKRGDHVRLEMTTGERIRITVRGVQPDSIIATNGTRYNVADVRSIEHRTFSPTRTVVLAVGIFVAIIVLLANSSVPPGL